MGWSRSEKWCGRTEKGSDASVRVHVAVFGFSYFAFVYNFRRISENEDIDYYIHVHSSYILGYDRRVQHEGFVQ